MPRRVGGDPSHAVDIRRAQQADGLHEASGIRDPTDAPSLAAVDEVTAT